jgi:hypothetical protein
MFWVLVIDDDFVATDSIDAAMDWIHYAGAVMVSPESLSAADRWMLELQFPGDRNA